VTALACLALAVVPVGGEGPARDDPDARTLVLALDGVAYRVVEAARDQGAFTGWPSTSRLIAPFPSVTNVAFTEMFQPAGLGPVPGYEDSHFDRESNDIVNNSPFNYEERSFPWRDEFDAIGMTLTSKLEIYVRPRKKARKELVEIEKALFASPNRVVLAHMGATDAMHHIFGDEDVLDLLMDVDVWIREVRQRHERELGSPLHFVLLSDHGNTLGKVTSTRGYKRRLRKAGFTIRTRLEEENDIVASAFGMIGFGALYVAPLNAERAARTVVDHHAVDFAVWVSGPDELDILAEDGEATVRWRDVDGERSYAYRRIAGDPLELRNAVRALDGDGLLGADGFASDRDWLHYTARAAYPDAPYRLVESLTGRHLENHATVLFSMKPGNTWGSNSAKAGSFVRAGQLEGTHGGLDRDSSTGFLLPDLASRVPPDEVVRAADALREYLDQRYPVGQTEVAGQAD
jgi:hypothetical protein